MAIIGAVLLAAGLFLIIPLTQTLDAAHKDVVEYREIITLQAPPPTPPAPEEQQRTQEQEQPQPELEENFQELTLNQLELSLNPGIGEALAMGMRSVTFKTEIDAAAEIEKIFSFEDLPEAPRLITEPKVEFPRDLARRGIKEGRFELLIEIDERGKVRLVRVLSASHPQFEKLAADFCRQARFTSPRIDGKAVTVRGKIPITLRDR